MSSASFHKENYLESGEAFLDAIESGNLPQIHKTIDSGQLTPYYLDEGLVLAVAGGIQPGYVDVVTALLKAGALILPWVRNALPGEDLTQSPAVIRVLFEYGLDPNATQSCDFEPRDSLKQTGGEPLLQLINDPACAREFLLCGADPNAIGLRGETILYCALIAGQVRMAEILVECGARLDPNLLFTTIRPQLRGPLRDAETRELMTKFLLDEGVDPNQATSEIFGTPLHLAVFYPNEAIIKMLLEAGADHTKLSTGWRTTGLTSEQMLCEGHEGNSRIRTRLSLIFSSLDKPEV